MQFFNIRPNIFKAAIISLFFFAPKQSVWAQSGNLPIMEDSLVTNTELIDEAWNNEEDAVNENDEDVVYISPNEQAAIHPVSIEQDKWNKLTDSEDFNYYKNQKVTNNSAFMQWFGQLIDFLVTSGQWILYLFVAIIVSIVVYLIVKKVNLMPRKQKKGITTDLVTGDNLATIDFDKLIREAIQNNKIEESVVLIYQHLVYLLKQNKTLYIDNNTTNAQILSKIRAKDYYKLTKQQFVQFEYVHFGEYPISQNQFEQYHHSYQILKKKIIA